MASRNQNVFSTQYPSGIIFVGSILAGIGVGMLKKEIGAYTLIGLGVGFVLAGLVTMSNRNSFLKR